ncbi:MAG: four helix bundle protein [Vicinamibacterales bacterium]|nr:four helix bundle protein [Vicinamibacterales bacterium]
MADRQDLRRRTRQFALDALKFFRKLPKTPEAQVPGLQFYRAATAVDANYHAARRGRSRAEFTAKLGLVVEESDEVVNWLEFMRDGQIASDPALLSEAQQLCAIFTTARETARKRNVP